MRSYKRFLRQPPSIRQSLHRRSCNPLTWSVFAFLSKIISQDAQQVVALVLAVIEIREEPAAVLEQELSIVDPTTITFDPGLVCHNAFRPILAAEDRIEIQEDVIIAFGVVHACGF